MTNREFIEARYILCDEEYVKYCRNEAECYEIERGLKYDRDCWLFNAVDYGLEDDYGEESEP